MNVKEVETNSATKKIRYEIYGTHAERLAMTTEFKSTLASGTYFVETDATGQFPIYMWDDVTQDWGEF